MTISHHSCLHHFSESSLLTHGKQTEFRIGNSITQREIKSYLLKTFCSSKSGFLKNSILPTSFSDCEGTAWHCCTQVFISGKARPTAGQIGRALRESWAQSRGCRNLASTCPDSGRKAKAFLPNSKPSSSSLVLNRCDQAVVSQGPPRI